jgi:hypothetical protein
MDYQKAWEALKERYSNGIKTLEENDDDTLSNQITIMTYMMNLVEMDEIENNLKNAN